MRFYFTFGSDPKYPFGRNDYVVVEADTHKNAIREYRRHHPNRPGSNCYNAADSYSERQWETIYKKYYDGRDPVEVLSAN